jgi:hypothetical protein
MTNPVFVSSYITLRSNQILLNGEVIFEAKEVTTFDFLQAAYDHFQLNYPKFFKMDNLCKTGFIASELLLRTKKLSDTYQPEQIGIILSSANSSLDTDIKYEASIATAPSPSLFVYTLPNVLIGEICIRHRIKGEAACFVFDIFDATFQTDYVNLLFETGKVKACISGWADYYNNKAEAFFYLVENTSSETALKHNAKNINRIWNNLNS